MALYAGQVKVAGFVGEKRVGRKVGAGLVGETPSTNSSIIKSNKIFYSIHTTTITRTAQVS